MDAVTQMVFMIALLLILGALGEFIFSRTGIPDMIWLVLAGIITGPVLEIIQPDIFKPAIPFFGAIALVSILAGGGVKLRISEVTEIAPRAFILALVGFVLTLVAFCIFAHYATRLGLIQPVPVTVWIMAGAILGGTSSLIIIPTMAGGGVASRVARLLEVESCITDALCVVVAMAMIDLILKDVFSFGAPFISLASAVGLGVVVGLAGAVFLLMMKSRLADSPHAYTVYLSGFLIIYGAAQFCGGNGALAVLTSALIIGNLAEILPRITSHQFDPKLYTINPLIMTVHDQLSFFIKSFFFFLIGLMFPTSPKLLLLGFVFALFMLVFRLPAVMVAMRGGGFTFFQKALVTVAIPRGMAAGVLSALPMYYGVKGVDNLSQGVFSAIFFSILVFSIGFWVVKQLESRQARGGQTKQGDMLLKSH